MGQHRPREPDRSEYLDLEILAPDLLARLEEREGPPAAGVVHQDVDAAETLHGGGDHALDVVGHAHVAGYRQHLAAGP